MRTMEIHPFPGPQIQITDLELLIKPRLLDDLVIWPNQALPLVGYMAWQNDAAARNRWVEAHRCNDRSVINDLVAKA